MSFLWGDDETPDVVEKDDQIRSLEGKMDVILETLKNQKESNDLERARIWSRIDELSKSFRSYRDRTAVRMKRSAMGFVDGEVGSEAFSPNSKKADLKPIGSTPNSQDSGSSGSQKLEMMKNADQGKSINAT